jgi:hypothetical protein
MRPITWARVTRLVARLLPFLVALAVYTAGYAVMDGEPNGIALTGDEPHYVLESWSLVEDLDRNLADEYAAFFPTTFQRHAYGYTAPGQLISVHNVGLPLLLTPAALVDRDKAISTPGREVAPGGSSGRWARVEMLLISALAASLLLGLLRQLQLAGAVLVYAVWGAVVFSLPLLAGAAQLYPEMPAAALVLLSLRCIAMPNPGRRQILLASVAAALLPWLHVRYWILVAGLCIGLVVRVGLGRREIVRALAPVGLSAVAMAVAFQVWYGSPLFNAQYRLPETGAAVHANGSFWYRHLAGNLLSPEQGWLPLAPVGILAVAGLGYLCWRYGWWAICGTAVAVVYVVAVGSADQGNTTPARYLLPVMPLAAIPLLAVVSNVRPARVAFWALLALSVAFSVDGTTHAGLIYNDGAGGASRLALSVKLRSLWPQLFPARAGANAYPDAAMTVAWVIGLAFLAWLFVAARDELQVRRRRGGPRPAD